MLGLTLNSCTMKEVYDKFGLEATTRDFIGHSMALYQTDDYINEKGMAHDDGSSFTFATFEHALAHFRASMQRLSG